jgi:hypothetical protein
MFDLKWELFVKFDLVDYPNENSHPLGIGFTENLLFIATYWENNNKILWTVDRF